MFLSDAIYSTSLTVSLIPQVEMNSFSLCSLHSPAPQPHQVLVFRFIEFCLYYLPHDSGKIFSGWYFFRGKRVATTTVCCAINFSIHLSWKLLILSSANLQIALHTQNNGEMQKSSQVFINDFLHSLSSIAESCLRISLLSFFRHYFSWINFFPSIFKRL